MVRSTTFQIRLIALVAVAASVTGCGSIEAGDDGGSGQIDSILGDADTAADAPGSLAAVDQDDAEDSGGVTGLPSLGGVEDVLDRFTACLNAEGADVAPTSLSQMTAKLTDLPPDADRAATFAHFYDRDINDPTVAAAIVACDHILDDPAISIFIPSS